MSRQQEPSAAVRQAMETLDLAIKGAKVYARDDLVQRLTGARQLLSEPAVTVYVVGEFKQGKSSLINALLGTPICPVDDDIATAVPTEVRYAEKPAATAYYEPDGEGWGPGWSEPIPFGELISYVSEQGNPGNRRKLRSVAVGIDRQLLAGGLVMVDTPGVGGLGSVHNALTVGTLPRAHAVLFVTDASQELTGSELKFLWTAEELCPTILFVLTKTDLYPHWRRILELDLAHLHSSGFRPVEPIAVSSALRARAGQRADRVPNGQGRDAQELAAQDLDAQELDAESGVPALVSALRRVVADAEQVALHSVAHHVLGAVGQLETTLKSRKSALDHPERSAQLLAELTEARERADRLRGKSARWQTVLLDGMADVSSDVDFDLRSRVRMVLADAEKAIDDGDPAINWPEFEGWLRQRLAGDTLENYALLVRGAKEVAQRVAEHFELAESAITPVEVRPPIQVVETIETDTSFTTENKRLKSGLAGFQKGYMGFAMILMVNALSPVTIPAAFGLLTGAILGRSGFQEERARQLEKRRSQAKTAVRRFVDDFNMQVGKGSRDDLRRLQRELRNGYTRLAEELQRSMSEALSAAQQAVNANETDSKEVKRMEADLRSLDMLRGRAGKMAAAPAHADTRSASVVRSGIAG